MTNRSQHFDGRTNCPCCGYPTLEAGEDYEICELCSWEDDGQSDEDADEVRGGPNADYSLKEARSNFAKYRVMYEPGRHPRITGADSKLEWETKGILIEAFKSLASGIGDRETLIKDILLLEEILRNETSRQVKEYESKDHG